MHRLAAAAVALLLLTGCSSVVSGAGHVAPGALPGRPSVPAPSPAPSTATGTPAAPGTSSSTAHGAPKRAPSRAPAPKRSAAHPAPKRSAAGDDFDCPTIRYPYAHLAFRCITSPMDEQPSDPVWPLSLAHVVEPRTDWSVSAGAGHLGSPHGRSLRSITSYVRGEMVSNGNYGRPRPAVRTLSARRITVHGAHAFVLESQFRLNASYRRASHERVHVEKSWTLAIRVGRNDYSLWFVSIPDLAKRLWRTVPADIASIRVI